MMHQKHYLKQKKEKKTEIASATPISTQQPHQQQNLNDTELLIVANLEEGEVTEVEAENTLKPIR